MKQKSLPTKKRAKLHGRARALASKLIAEEVRAGLPRRQAIAVGMSRARASQKKSELDRVVNKYL